jgi:4-aminobutyrate aminotransferase-like enzyme
LEPKSCRAECFDDASSWIDRHADRISCVVVEPAIGARGYYFAPPVFFQRLREVTRRHGIVLIDDEIQMGLGRLGSLFACQIQSWEPDLVVLGKSLGGGLIPISAVVGRSDIMDSLPPGYESETFAANPLACRVALEAMDLLVGDRMDQRALQIESWLDSGLRSLQRRSTLPIRISCQGASGVIEVQGPTSSEAKRTDAGAGRAAKIALEWVEQARDAGLLVHLSGIHRDRIVLIPPLIADENHFQVAFGILRDILSQPIHID